MKTETKTIEQSIFTCETCGHTEKIRSEIRTCHVCGKDCCDECGVTEFSREYPEGDQISDALVGARVYCICAECYDKVNTIADPIYFIIRKLEDHLDSVVENWVRERKVDAK